MINLSVHFYIFCFRFLHLTNVFINDTTFCASNYPSNILRLRNLKNNESCNGYLFNHFWLFITLFDCYHTDCPYCYKRHMFARF